MRVLVTGAAGYLGRAVVSAFAAAGYAPIAMAHKPIAAMDGAVQVRVADLLEPESMPQAVRGVDAVCHLAGLGNARESVEAPLVYYRVNTAGTVALLEAMVAEGARQLVFASTASIYATSQGVLLREDAADAPTHPYASSKLAAEWAIEAQARTGALGSTVLRLMNLTGGHDSNPTRLIPRTIAAALGGGVLAINGDGSVRRDYVHVEDVAAAFVAALDNPAGLGAGRRYNIGSGCGTSILDIVAVVERVTGRSVPVRHEPAAPEPAVLVADPSKARAELGWTATHSGIDALVRDTWRAMGY